MATVRYIVNSAMRKIGRLAGGREPRAADQTDVLAALQGMYLSWIAAGTLGRMTDVIPLTDYVAGENERIIRNPDVGAITLPEYVSAYTDPRPYDQERTPYPTRVVDTNIRPPRDCSVVQIKDVNAGTVATYIYDGAYREWATLETLQLDNNAPRSNDDPEGLSALLATEIADTFGAEVGVATQRQAIRFLTALTQRFSAPRHSIPGVYC